MRMPKFTAELSLRETEGHYRTAVSHVPTSGNIRPAADCYSRCFNNCIDGGGYDWECSGICHFRCLRRRFAT